jgi:hypothetical protein
MGRGAACVKELARYSLGERLTMLRKTNKDISKLSDNLGKESNPGSSKSEETALITPQS